MLSFRLGFLHESHFTPLMVNRERQTQMVMYGWQKAFSEFASVLLEDRDLNVGGNSKWAIQVLHWRREKSAGVQQ